MRRLWNNSLVAKVFLCYLVVIAILFASLYFTSNTTLRQSDIHSLSTHMEQEARLLERAVPHDVHGEALHNLCQQLSADLGSRITLIARDGTVLCDSSEASAKMENHVGRPEVVEALRTGSGTAIRYSTTVRYEMLYRAFYQLGPNDGRIVRVATPLGAIAAWRRSLVIGLALASVAGLILTILHPTRIYYSRETQQVTTHSRHQVWLFSRYLSRRFRHLFAVLDQSGWWLVSARFLPRSGFG